MAQKQKQLVLAEYNLGLNNDSLNYKNDGLAKQILNIECKNGKLQSASMFDDLFALIEPTRAESASQVFRDTIGECKWVEGYQFFNGEKLVDYVVFCRHDNKIFYYEIGAANPRFTCLENVYFTSEPRCQFYIKDNTNIMIFCSQTDNMWVWDGMSEPYQVLDAPSVSSMAVGMNRLFVINDMHPYSVLFSDDLDPSNWCMSAGEAGEVVFNDDLGKTLLVFALDNYIYVVRDRGIIKLYSYNETKNSFNVSRVFVSNCQILKNTIAPAGDKIIFMATDGVYSFDGLSAKKIYNQLNMVVKNINFSVAKCINNTYYLCTNLYEKLNYNNAIVSINLETENITNICHGSIYKNLCKLNVNNTNNLVVISCDIISKNAKTPQYICKNVYKNDKNADFLYFSQELNLQPHAKNKMLCKLTFLCKNDAKLCIITDTQTKEFNIKKSTQFQTIKLNLKANIFAFKIYGEGDIDISHIVLDYSFVE